MEYCTTVEEQIAIIYFYHIIIQYPSEQRCDYEDEPSFEVLLY